MSAGRPRVAPDVSVIVACRNEGACIADFVRSLLAQETGDLHWEAVIADGMSDDNTRVVLGECANRDSRIVLIENRGKIVSTGLNAAIRVARGEFILRMDAHTEYAPDYIRACVEVLRESGADNVGGPARTSATGYWARSIAAAYHSPFACGGARFHDPGFEGDVDTVPYGCWRKSTLEALGLFDESLVRNQDDEMNLRLIRRGGRIFQSPRIVSWYRPRRTLQALFRQYMQYGFWKVAVIRKHMVPASWRHLVPGAFVASHAFFALITCMAMISGYNWFAAALIWLSLWVAYVAAATFAAVPLARRHGWDLLLPMPLVFATYHISYGIGFLAGLQHFRDPRRSANDRFSGLSR